MKRIMILDILLNICAFFMIMIPNILCYGLSFNVSPLLIEWIVPFYLLIINIKFSEKYECKYPIWRLFHSVLIMFVGFYCSHKYVEWYYTAKNSILDPWTEVLMVDIFIINVLIIVLGLSIHQIKVTKLNRGNQTSNGSN